MIDHSNVDCCPTEFGRKDFDSEEHYQMMLQFADAKDADASDPEIGDIIWGWEFIATQDDATCDLCNSFNGIRLPKHHPFWKYGRPPIRRKCRCDREVITILDVERGDANQTPEHLVPKDWRKDRTA